MAEQFVLGMVAMFALMGFSIYIGFSLIMVVLSSVYDMIKWLFKS